MMSVGIKVSAVVLLGAVVILALMTGILARQRRRELKEARRDNRARRLWPLRTRKQCSRSPAAPMQLSPPVTNRTSRAGHTTHRAGLDSRRKQP